MWRLVVDPVSIRGESSVPGSNAWSSRVSGPFWSTGEGRRKRVYELTRAGSDALAQARSDWGEFARAVDSIIEWA